ncbi:MAG TPA: DUF6457 domain-containing protein [Actinomycetota bacterium]|jgi:hypothetical protein|nr:DUF6457 domain-containing protein [Actinomycetota bacterium]
MQDWLSEYSAALAVELPGLAVDLPPSLELADELLNLARIIAEGTGEKTNAPLSTFMVGRFVGLTAESGISTEDAVKLATEIAERTIQSRG